MRSNAGYGHLLTPREQAVWFLTCEPMPDGNMMTDKEIASSLGVAPDWVRKVQFSIRFKLKTNCRCGEVAIYHASSRQSKQ